MTWINNHCQNTQARQRQRGGSAPDVGWPWAKAGFELKSARWHGTPSGLRRDVRRDNEVKVLGWTLLDATPAGLRGPGSHLIDQAAKLLAAATRAG